MVTAHVITSYLVSNSSMTSTAFPLLAPHEPPTLAIPHTCQAHSALGVSSAGSSPHPHPNGLLSLPKTFPQMSPYQTDPSWPSMLSRNHLPVHHLPTLFSFLHSNCYRWGQFWPQNVSDFPKHIVRWHSLTFWSWMQPCDLLCPGTCEKCHVSLSGISFKIWCVIRHSIFSPLSWSLVILQLMDLQAAWAPE